MIEKINFFEQSVSQEMIIEMFSQMQLMLDANLSLIETLQLLKSNESNKRLIKILDTMYTTVQQGNLFKNRLIQDKNTLGLLPIIFLDLGQRNDDLKGAIKILVQLLELKLESQQKLKKAFQYPIILFSTLMISIATIFIYLLPQFEPLFTQFGDQLPLQTKLLLDMKDFISEYLLFILGLIFFIVAFVYYQYRSKNEYRMIIDEVIVTRIFIVRKLVLWFELLVIFKTMHLLLEQKFTLQEAIEKVIPVIQNNYIKIIFIHISSEINKGMKLDQVVSRYKIFDPLIVKLILVGHNSDQFDLIFGKISNIFQQRFNKLIERFIKLVEPIFLFVMALFIVWIMLAIFIPLWDIGKVLN